MCGIYGIVGHRRATSLCLEGLKSLEYRGYDSSGIAALEKGAITIVKEKGKIKSLEKCLEGRSFESNLAIAHTRWATHGEPNQSNAHPHFDEKESVALVHNGIIENHQSIKEELLVKGVRFHSETDTEVMAQLIAYLYEGDLVQAVLSALKKLEGALAIAVIHKDHPDEIVAAARESPLAIARSKEMTLLSSDPNAFSGDGLSITFLHADEVALLKKDDCLLYNCDGKRSFKEESQDRYRKKLSL